VVLGQNLSTTLCLAVCRRLRAVVDKFVILESNVSHTGLGKRMLFKEHRERFAAFADQIVHVEATDFEQQLCSGDAWACELRSRGLLQKKLGELHLAPWDVIISGDVDEIPHPAAIRRFRHCAIEGMDRSNAGNVFILEATMLMYNTRCFAKPNWLHGPHMGYWFQFASAPPTSWRPFSHRARAPPSDEWIHSAINYRRWGNTQYSSPVWKQSAWHLSNFLSIEGITNKLQRISHGQEYAVGHRAQHMLDPARIAAAVHNCTDVAESGKYRQMRKWTPPPRDPLLEYIRTRFGEKLWPTWPHKSASA